MFQSTHPRRVWHEEEAKAIFQVLFQSTHPRRVWPCSLNGDGKGLTVSIHTPTKGVTRSGHEPCPCRASFNPHTHEGCDWHVYFWFPNRYSFNPHTHEGCDLSNIGYQIEYLKFQSTHPRRVWHNWFRTNFAEDLFQSTHPRRVWQIRGIGHYLAAEFQSTHPRRVWPYLYR